MSKIKKNISCIIAMEADNVTGILTETDLLKKAIVQGKDTRRMKVSEIMSSPVETIPSDMSVLEAGNIMEDKKIKFNRPGIIAKARESPQFKIMVIP